MKQLFIIALAVAAMSCGNKKSKNQPDLAANVKAANDTANFTEIQWIDSVANFGTVNAGQKVEVKFIFKNIGNKPLFLTDVHPGCGCTTSDYTKEPVAPGKEGWVTGIFNSEGQHGEVHKYINVTSNTRNATDHRLSFTGTVKSDEKQPEPVKTN